MRCNFFRVGAISLFLLCSVVAGASGQSKVSKYEHKTFEVVYLIECNSISLADEVTYLDFEGVEHVFKNVALPFRVVVTTADYVSSQDPLVPNDIMRVVVDISKRNNPIGGKLVIRALLQGKERRTYDYSETLDAHSHVIKVATTDLDGNNWVDDRSKWAQDEDR